MGCELPNESSGLEGSVLRRRMEAMTEEPNGRQEFLEWENEYLRKRIKELPQSEIFYRLAIAVIMVVCGLSMWWLP